MADTFANEFSSPQDPKQMPAQSSAPGATDADAPEVVIAVMGATGSGKSTFINLISGADLGVSDGLRSCTSTVELTGSFNLDGRRVVLIDTPGFDDTTRSDTDVLNTIASFLATTYEHGRTLAGVLYFHRISDFRMGGISMRNLKMFRKLCGESTLRNVVVVTNMWGQVDPKVGNAREAELMTDDIFFKPVLDKGAQTARHENTITSAQNIIRLVLNNHPVPLRIQVELVDEHKDISETSAGEELSQEINALIVKHQEEVRVLREEMEQAMRDKDEETRRELGIEIEKMQREVEKFKNDSERLTSDYKEEKARTELHFAQMEEEGKRAAEEAAAKVRAEGKEEAERLAAQYQQQIDKLEESLRAGEAVSRSEKAKMRRKIRELQKAQARAIAPAQGLQIFTRLGAFIDKWLMPI